MSEPLHIGLVACCSEKLPTAAPAKILYQSELFTKSRKWVKSNCGQWLILSAKHHVVHPDEFLDPYNETLNDRSAAERLAWSTEVSSQLVYLFPDPTNTIFYILAGEKYCGYLVGLLLERGYRVERPMEGLTIGRQLQWLNRATSSSSEESFF